VGRRLWSEGSWISRWVEERAGIGFLLILPFKGLFNIFDGVGNPLLGCGEFSLEAN